jgi:hypothetical protein
MLNFNSAWRFNAPNEIDGEAVREFNQMISTISRGNQNTIEYFKKYFSGFSGYAYSRSSDLGWAESDLFRNMWGAAKNAPLFIEAFYDACYEKEKDFPVPDLSIINQILSTHETGYRIEPPNLIYNGELNHEVIVPLEVYVSLEKKAQDIIQQSLANSKKHLNEGSYRAAVQESLWLLETISTIFKGVQVDDDTKIVGKYFSKIIPELKKKKNNQTLSNVINWIEILHGFLSSTTRGGIRHGMDLQEGIATTSQEAKLYCDLIASYISYLLSEYEQLNMKL